MCGILGIIQKGSNLDTYKRFERALSLLQHRGPDYQSVLTIDNVILGHTRLSIIDLTASANQPFFDREKKFVIVYNGEVYNYIELRKELSRLGHVFTTTSDTEVIVESYKEWGIVCLQKFNGMFSFFLYDIQKKKGFAVRDRFGVKPFYYTHLKEGIAFSSEIKPLLHLGAEVRPNYEYIQSFIVEAATDYGSGCMLSGVNQLEPGQYAVIENGNMKTYSWWTNDNLLIEVPERFEERLERYRELLFDAVKIRLRSDVRTAITLSGGMDSTSIYCGYQNLARNDETINNDKKLSVFTIEYNTGSEIDEIPAVKLITDYFKDAYTPVSISEINPIHFLKESLYYQEFPAWNISSITYQQIYRAIRKHGITVLLEGHGNDEVLGGYHSHISRAIACFLREGNFKDAWRTSRIFSAMRNSKVQQHKIHPLVVLLYNSLPAARIIRESHLLRQINKSNVWDNQLKFGYVEKMYNPSFSRFSNELLHLVNKTILPTVLRVFDRATMASSIEMRAPFMDYRLIQYAFSIPDSDKVGEEYQKRILRESMKGYMPEEIRTDKIKRGFSGDIVNWLHSQESHRYIQNEILSKIHSGMPINKQTVLKYFDEKRNAKFTWKEAVNFSRIISLILWWKLFIDNEYKDFVPNAP